MSDAIACAKGFLETNHLRKKISKPGRLIKSGLAQTLWCKAQMATTQWNLWGFTRFDWLQHWKNANPKSLHLRSNIPRMSCRWFLPWMLRIPLEFHTLSACNLLNEWCSQKSRYSLRTSRGSTNGNGCTVLDVTVRSQHSSNFCLTFC